MEMHLKKTQIEGPPDLGSDFNFEKCKYVLPASLSAPLMSARTVVSSIKKTDKDAKKSKKDKKESSAVRASKETPSNQKKPSDLESKISKMEPMSPLAIPVE